MSSLKVINIGDPGTGVRYGGDDLDTINMLLSGQDLGYNLKMENPFYFGGANKLRILRPDGIHYISINTEAETTNRSLLLKSFGADTYLVVGTDLLVKSNLHSQIAYMDAQNTFTEPQTILKNTDKILSIYRPSNDAVEWGIDFEAWNSEGEQQVYSNIRTGLVDNTKDHEYSYLAFAVMKDGSFDQKMILNHDGTLLMKPTSSSPFTILDFSATSGTSKRISFQNAEQIVVGRDTSDTLTNKILLDSGTGNQIGIHVPYTFTIYQTASNYIVRNNLTGALQSFSNTDFAPALEWAVNNIVNVGSGTQSDFFSGSIFIQRGIYTATSTIDIDIDVATRHGVQILGEGPGTIIYLNPASTQTDGILISMEAVAFKDIRIIANDKITYIVHRVGHGGAPRHDYHKFDNVWFEGPNIDAGNGSVTYVSGQVGLFNDGELAAIYFSTVSNCRFLGLEKGIWMKGQHSTSCAVGEGTMFYGCEIGVDISNTAGQNEINHIWFQGEPQVGTSAVRIQSSAGGQNIVDNVISELHRTDNGLWVGSGGTSVDCQTVLLESGVSNNRIGNHIMNAYDGHVDYPYSKTIRDNSGNRSNGSDRNLNVFGDNFMWFDDDIDIIFFNPNKYVHMFSGKLLLNDSTQSSNWIVTAGGDLPNSVEIKLPVVSAGIIEDWFLFRDTAAPIKNKTMDFDSSNPDKNIATNIGDSAIAQHTSTKITITDKTHLPSDAVYTTGTQTISNKIFTTPIVNGVQFAYPAAAKTTNYTATTTDYYIPVDTTAGDITISLPAVSSDLAGQTYVIYKKAGTGKVIIDADGSETINGQLTMTLFSEYQHARIECTGTEWIGKTDYRVREGYDILAEDFNEILSPITIFPNTGLYVNDNNGSANYIIRGGDIASGEGSKFIDLPNVRDNDRFVFSANAWIKALSGTTISTTPYTPPSSGYVWLFFDTDTSKLSIMDSGGTITPLT